MSEDYNFDLGFQAGSYTVQVDTSAGVGYFEHDILGDGGELKFTGKALSDCCGVRELPGAVVAGLRDRGFSVGMGGV